MVTFELHYRTLSRQTIHLQGNLRNLGTVLGTVVGARFLCELAASPVTPPLQGCVAFTNPWSMSLAELVGQALPAALLRDRGPRIDLRNVLDCAELTLSVAGLESLSASCWGMYEDFEDSGGLWGHRGRAHVTPWLLAQQMLLRAATRTDTASLAISPMKRMPRTYRSGDVLYCRSGDLSPELRQRFEHAHCLAPQPAVTGISDAVHPHDIARFIAVEHWTVASRMSNQPKQIGSLHEGQGH